MTKKLKEIKDSVMQEQADILQRNQRREIRKIL